MAEFDSIRLNTGEVFNYDNSYSVNKNRWDVVSQQFSQNLQAPVWTISPNELLKGKTIGELLGEKTAQGKTKASHTKRATVRRETGSHKTSYRTKSAVSISEKSKAKTNGGAKNLDVADKKNQTKTTEKAPTTPTEEAKILKELQQDVLNLSKEDKEYLRDYFNTTTKNATWIKTYKDKQGRTVRAGLTQDGTPIKEISGDKNGDGLPMKLTTIGDTEMLTVTDGDFEHSTFGSDVDTDKDGALRGYRTTITTNTQTGVTTREMATSTTRNPDGTFTRETEYLTYNSDGTADKHGFESLDADGTVSIFDGNGNLVEQFGTNPPQEEQPRQQSENHTASGSHISSDSAPNKKEITSSVPMPIEQPEDMPFIEELPEDNTEEAPMGYFEGGTNRVDNIFRRTDED